MRNFMKKFKILPILGMILAFIFCFSACTGAKIGADNADLEGASTNSGYNDSAYDNLPSTKTVTSATEKTLAEEFSWNNGTHIQNKQVTSNFIIKDAKTDYKVLSGKSSGKEGAEFIPLFKEATGIKLQKVMDNTISEFDKDAKYFYFGDESCAYAQKAIAAGVDLLIPSAVGTNGYIVKTYGNTVFVIGKSNIGSMFGIYELLNQLFGYEVYGGDYYYIDKSIASGMESDLPFYSLNIVETPDIAQRFIGYAEEYQNKMNAHHMKTTHMYDEGYVSPGFHNTLTYLPKSTYQSAHPKWYASKGSSSQLCYCAQGDEAEYRLMVKEMAKKVLAAIEKQPEKTIATITQMDDTSWCTCDTCTKLKTNYGGGITNSPSQIRFINDCTALIYYKMNQNPEKYNYRNESNFKVATFAYYSNQYAPRKFETNNPYVCYDPRVTILYAPLDSMHSTRSINDPLNDQVKLTLEDWFKTGTTCEWWNLWPNDPEVAGAREKIQTNKHASQLAVWCYQTSFGDKYFYPYNSYDAMQQNYKAYLHYGVQWIFNQGVFNAGNAPHFERLKAYLESKLGWNVNLDVEVLTDNFFEYFYGAKDGGMRKLYNSLKVWVRYLEDTQGYATKPNAKHDVASYWPAELNKQWDRYITEAFEDIEQYKYLDYNYYEKLNLHIRLERVFVDFLYIKYNSGLFSDDQLLELKARHRDDILATGITRYGEGDSYTIDKYLDKL